MRPLYSKNEVRRAGGVLRSTSPAPEDRAWADKVLAHWRSAHEEPLKEILAALASIKPDSSTVAGRLKRIDTIQGKLRREGQHHELDTMYDIAGCRIIVQNLDDIPGVREAICNLFEVHKLNDYIVRPKDTGYRSLHVISRHQSLSLGYTNLKVETQIRTRLQHSWATAVESYDLISRSHLKFGSAGVLVGRFFALAANVLAVDEGAPLVSGLPSDTGELSDELRSIDSQLHILERLDAFSQSMQSVSVDKNDRSPAYYLISANLDDQQIIIKPIFDSNSLETMAEYGEMEREKNTPDDVLLVKADSIEELRKAYPNYFSNIEPFINVLRLVIKRG